jgi:hypothetical protein
MFLSGVLFVLFLAGCWLYWLTDAALTPAKDFPGLSKRVWSTVISVTFILGAIAWVITRNSRRARHGSATPAGPPALTGYDALNVRWHPYHLTAAENPFLAAEALASHPASRARNTPKPTVPIGPDDDPEFLRELAERIRGEQ